MLFKRVITLSLCACITGFFGCDMAPSTPVLDGAKPVQIETPPAPPPEAEQIPK